MIRALTSTVVAHARSLASPRVSAAPARRRWAAMVALALALAACGGDKDATPGPAPDRAAATAPAAPESAAALVPAPSIAAAQPAPAAPSEVAPSEVAPSEPVEKALAALAEKAPTGDPAARAQAGGTASAAQSATPPALANPSPARAGAAAALPKAPGGILPPGEADKILKLGATPTVKLIEAGAGPRAELSYAFIPGKQVLGMKLDLRMGISVGGKSIPATPVPQMVMLLDLTAGDRSPAGDTRVEGTIQGVTVDAKGPAQEQIAGAMRPQLDALKGVGMTHLVSSKGHVHDLKLKLPPGLPAAAEQMLTGMSQSFESMVAPLPVEPVGKGARWQVVTRVVNAGTDIVQLATYTLKSRAGQKATIDVAITQLASSGSIKAPGMPPGVTATLRSFNSTGSGTTRVDMTSIAPDGGQIGVRSVMDIDVLAGPGGAADKSSVDMTMAVELFRPGK